MITGDRIEPQLGVIFLHRNRIFLNLKILLKNICDMTLNHSVTKWGYMFYIRISGEKIWTPFYTSIYFIKLSGYFVWLHEADFIRTDGAQMSDVARPLVFWEGFLRADSLSICKKWIFKKIAFMNWLYIIILSSIFHRW